MTIVQFENGQYAIRKWRWLNLGYEFLDLKNKKYWWSQKDYYFKYYLTDDIEKLKVIKYKKPLNKLKHEKVEL